MPYTLPALPYAYDALEPVIDEETLHVHHDKHHAKYVDTLNQLLKDAGAQPQSLEAVIREAGWAICMDVDEFINIKIGDGTLGALYAALGDANMISLTWRLFGDSGVAGYEDRFLLDQFTRCALLPWVKDSGTTTPCD